MKNKYDKEYNIRLSSIKDTANIMQFIDENWKKGHILASNKNLFEYEFREGNNVNMILAEKKATNSIEALFGFIKCRRDGGEEYDIWGSFWKVKDEKTNLPFLGIELAKRALEISGARSHIGNGANPNTTGKLRQLIFKEKVDKMRHFYMLNPKKDKFDIAVIQTKPIVKYKQNDVGVNLIKLDTINEFKLKFDITKYPQIPQKDVDYIEYRYYN